MYLVERIFRSEAKLERFINTKRSTRLQLDTSARVQALLRILGTMHLGCRLLRALRYVAREWSTTVQHDGRSPANDDVCRIDPSFSRFDKFSVPSSRPGYGRFSRPFLFCLRFP